MATSPSDLAIIDTSVAINLNATGCAARILAALPFRLLMTSIGAAELRHDRRAGRNDGALLAALVTEGLIRMVTLGTRGNEVFASLVIGPAAETLDDSEAATIAYAVERDISAVIDERKAVRICAQRFPGLRPLSTVDLLAMAETIARERRWRSSPAPGRVA